MRTEVKQLMRDLRASVLLDRPEAVDIALNGLLGLPGVASNDHLSESILDQIVLPIGEILSALRITVLRPLLNHPLAVGRAIGGVALAHRFMKHHDTTAKDLQKPGNDARHDVRQALGKALFEIGYKDPTKLFNLGKTWIADPNCRLKSTALIFLPGLASTRGSQIIALVSILNEEQDRAVKAALVDALNALARQGLAYPVLDLLARWSSTAHPNSWVICRVLSTSWVCEHPSEVKSILRSIQSLTGESSDIHHALKALRRHGLEIDL